MTMTIAGYDHNDGFHIPAQHLTKLTGCLRLRLRLSLSVSTLDSRLDSVLFPPDHLANLLEATFPVASTDTHTHTHTVALAEVCTVQIIGFHSAASAVNTPRDPRRNCRQFPFLYLLNILTSTPLSPTLHPLSLFLSLTPSLFVPSSIFSLCLPRA